MAAHVLSFHVHAGAGGPVCMWKSEGSMQVMQAWSHVLICHPCLLPDVEA